MALPTRLMLASGLVGALLFQACAGTSPAPTPTVAVNMDVGVGAPPPEGWRWVVAEINTAADEKTEATNPGHDFFWTFFVVNGSTEVTTADGKKLASAGEGVMIPAKQQHSHRYPPQSKVLAFDVRSANDNPDRFHGGTKVLLSEKIALRAAPGYKLRVRTFTVAPGGRSADSTIADPNFVYVADGTLTVNAGQSASTVEKGKSAVLPLNQKYTVSNQGAAPLRFILADVRPQ